MYYLNIKHLGEFETQLYDIFQNNFYLKIYQNNFSY